MLHKIMLHNLSHLLFQAQKAVAQNIISIILEQEYPSRNWETHYEFIKTSFLSANRLLY